MSSGEFLDAAKRMVGLDGSRFNRPSDWFLAADKTAEAWAAVLRPARFRAYFFGNIGSGGLRTIGTGSRSGCNSPPTTRSRDSKVA